MQKRTPFYEIHKELNAKLVDFGGFDMPVQYNSIRTEHKAVRNGVGVFDVSHMGEFFITGSESLDLIQHVTVNDASNLEPGKAQYTVMCYEDGGIVDDLIVYMLNHNEYMLVVNAANIQKDFEWIDDNNTFDTNVNNQSENTCLLAVQGPDSVATLQKLTEIDLSEIGFYRFREIPFGGCDNVIMSGTGYTGEKGFEVYFDINRCEPSAIWNKIMKAGEEFDIEPCGLGARDTLRLEMGFALYGNDISKGTNPLEAGLGWLTKLDKGDFIGREALREIKENGTDRNLTGFVVDSKRAIPRSGYSLYSSDGDEIGTVTSGSMSITLGKGIGMGYLKKGFHEEGTSIQIGIRNSMAGATVKKPPFIKK